MVDRILAIVPCLNEEKHIGTVLRMLVNANNRLPMRIVVADGGSTDRTPQITQDYAKQYPNVIFFSHPKVRQGPAVNQAVADYGDGAEYLIRIDAHADYPDDYCQRLVEEADAMKAASVVVAMKTAGKNWFQKAAAAAQNSKLGNGGSAHRTGGKGMWIDHGHHALMRIDAFRAVKGYDETFSHNEDSELDTRLTRAGYKIWLTDKTSLIYYPRSSTSSLFQQYYNYGQGRARNIVKNRSMPKLRQMVPAAVLPALVLGLFGPLSTLATLPFWLWAGFCLVYGSILAIKAKDPAIALSGPIAMIMHLGWSMGFWLGIAHSLKDRET